MPDVHIGMGRSGEGYILQSGDVDMPPLSPETLADMPNIRRAFIDAWNNPSPLQDGLRKLRAGDPVAFPLVLHAGHSIVAFSSEGAEPCTYGEFLNRM
jgi:hypothetical protein